jgi:hypothetical protein
MIFKDGTRELGLQTQMQTGKTAVLTTMAEGDSVGQLEMRALVRRTGPCGRALRASASGKRFASRQQKF